MRCKYRVGQIVAMMGTPASYDYMLLCDGSTISSTNYADLVSVLGGNTLPNLTGRVLQGATTAGTYLSAGLPNISGWVNLIYSIDAADSSIFKEHPPYSTNIFSSGWHGKMGYTEGSAGNIWYGNCTINASGASSIYGNSTTVQPPAMTVKYYICYTG